jgi:hypothetical protein
MAVGQNVLRKDGREKLTGAARYVDDITLEGMLFGKTVRSRIPRGRIKTINFDNYDDVEIQEPNTSRVPGSGPTVASRTCRGFQKKRVNGHNARNNFRGKDRLWLSGKKSSMNINMAPSMPRLFTSRETLL